MNRLQIIKNEGVVEKLSWTDYKIIKMKEWSRIYHEPITNHQNEGVVENLSWTDYKSLKWRSGWEFIMNRLQIIKMKKWSRIYHEPITNH